MCEDQEHQKKEGQGFYKLDETSMTAVRDKLSDDFYTLTTQHTTEITRLLEKYNDHQIQLALELEPYEKAHLRAQDEHKETKEDNDNIE